MTTYVTLLGLVGRAWKSFFIQKAGTQLSAKLFTFTTFYTLYVHLMFKFLEAEHGMPVLSTTSAKGEL